MAKEQHKIENENNKDDLGFGKAFSSSRGRLIREDGSFNVDRVGTKTKSLFHELIAMKWPTFLLMIFIFYAIINIFYAFIYFVIGIDQISGIEAGSWMHEFAQCYFFSVQSFTTVGYGGMHPQGYGANIISGIEALSGLLTFAIITGLVYSKFSKPKSKILFSKHVLLAPYKDIQSIQVRVSNEISNNILDLEASMIFGYVPKDGSTRILRILSLEIQKIALFPLSWTIVHPIDDKSPLKELFDGDTDDLEVEFLVILRGYDESYGQLINSMNAYTESHLVKNAKFVPMFELKDGKTMLYLEKIDEFIKLD
ncbi:MAG: transporter [Saprospiraceae bacterium]|uniref:Transporter n=1 Tax=Candidatus Defluviibacterium haderslevense TaxID=2981993 RepID=A0A9D7XEX9_9BACT|nr:transporter [Candidatus Defluviibacterium haderslevense]MBK9718091.1 transporter [Candidatus Defluviibacterium haderslevense]